MCKENLDVMSQSVRVCVCVGNCLDVKWRDRNEYTPSGPEALLVSVDTMRDETGNLHPVLVANWKIKDEGESV